MIGVMDSEEKLLQEALTLVKSQALEMKLSLDKGNLLEALKQASVMLGELRTSLLSPKNYYELYIVISDQLKHLELYLIEEYKKGGGGVPDLYELVQYFGNIIPRLYLLITVGLVYMKTNPKMRASLLRDLVEMCRGVQHPLRGLFLRNYLVQAVRGVLGDEPNKESIDFILTNFAEMNKLWVRMQHQGHSREREKREKEREELRLLVGTNLVRLSQLDSLGVESYSKLVLPGILEQIVSCRDVIAQEYLMECIIQVFPDEFHLATLQGFLKSCAELQPEVNVQQIVSILVDRLAAYAQKGDGTHTPQMAEVASNLFPIFSDNIGAIVQYRDMKVDDTVRLEVSLLNLALTCYPDQVEFVDQVLLSTREALEKFQVTSVEPSDTVYRELVHLLTLPIESYNNILTVVQLKNYAPLLDFLSLAGRRTIGSALLTNALQHNTFLSVPDEVDVTLSICDALISSPGEGELLGRFLHLLRSPSLDQHFLLLVRARHHLSNGSPSTLVDSFPSLVFAALQLAFQYSNAQEDNPNWEKKIFKIYDFTLETILALVRGEFYELSLKLFLQGSLAIGQLKLPNSEDTAYEFLTQAFTLYEERMFGSDLLQSSTLGLILSTFEQMRCFSTENVAPVQSQIFRAAAHLKEPSNSGALLLCTHLFWSQTDGRDRNERRLLDCLERAGKIALGFNGGSETTKAQLLLDVLNYYVYFFEQCPGITVEKINKVLKTIKGKLEGAERDEHYPSAESYLSNTLSHIKARMETCEEDLYEGILL